MQSILEAIHAYPHEVLYLGCNDRNLSNILHRINLNIFLNYDLWHINKAIREGNCIVA